VQLAHRKTEDSELSGPFRRQIGEASNSDAKPALNGDFDQIGGEEASETVMLIFRALQFSRLAMLSALAVGSTMSSSSQRRPWATMPPI
jgi:hypothetical protein